MAKSVTNPGQWQTGHSGNPKGRPRRPQALTQMLRAKGDSMVRVGGQPIQAQEALARAVWQFVLKGEVRLMGKHLEATSVTEWASVVKWLYAHVEPSNLSVPESEPEMIVRVLREDRIPPYGERTSPPEALTPNPSPKWRGEKDGEETGKNADDGEMIAAEDLIPQVLLSGGDDVTRLELESSEEDWL